MLESQRERFNKAAQYYGKFNIKDSLKGAYLSVMEGWKAGLFDAVMDFIETNEAVEKFPEPFQLDRLGKRIRQTLLQQHFEKDDAICYYCSNTGYVPEIIYPPVYEGRSVFGNLPCKCTRGQGCMKAKDHRGELIFIQGYFDKHRDIEFDEKIEDLEYCHIVYKHHMEEIEAIRKKEEEEEKGAIR